MADLWRASGPGSTAQHDSETGPVIVDARRTPICAPGGRLTGAIAPSPTGGGPR